MTAKEWLNRGYFIEREIERLQEERERAYNALFAVQKKRPAHVCDENAMLFFLRMRKVTVAKQASA